MYSSIYLSRQKTDITVVAIASTTAISPATMNNTCSLFNIGFSLNILLPPLSCSSCFSTVFVASNILGSLLAQSEPRI